MVYAAKLASRILGVGSRVFVTVASSLLLVALVKTLLITKPSTDAPPCHRGDVDFIPADDERMERFSEALRLKTISYKPHVYDGDAMKEFHRFLEKSFPLIHSSSFVRREIVNELSLLYTITGTETDAKSYVLAGEVQLLKNLRIMSKLWDFTVHPILDQF